jgi:hypothetical protein
LLLLFLSLFLVNQPSKDAIERLASLPHTMCFLLLLGCVRTKSLSLTIQTDNCLYPFWIYITRSPKHDQFPSSASETTTTSS